MSVASREPEARRKGVARMRLLTFMIVAILAAGVAFALSMNAGATFGAAALRAIVALVALQALYAVFLWLLSVLTRRDRKPPGD